MCKNKMIFLTLAMEENSSGSIDRTPIVGLSAGDGDCNFLVEQFINSDREAICSSGPRGRYEVSSKTNATPPISHSRDV
jgi:hypothetical protein